MNTAQAVGGQKNRPIRTNWPPEQEPQPVARSRRAVKVLKEQAPTERHDHDKHPLQARSSPAPDRTPKSIPSISPEKHQIAGLDSSFKHLLQNPSPPVEQARKRGLCCTFTLLLYPTPSHLLFVCQPLPLHPPCIFPHKCSSPRFCSLEKNSSNACTARGSFGAQPQLKLTRSDKAACSSRP